MTPEDLQAYHQTIQDTYDQRSGRHDASDWHRRTALKLVEGLPPRSGDRVLDLATGTGTIAFQAAETVGPEGKVVGVDLSAGMLGEANKKLSAAGLTNLEFMLADAEHLDFPPDSFDRIYCASAFFWMLEPLAVLKHWHELLSPGGGLAFHALPETAYVWVHEVRRALANHGIDYVLNAPTGTLAKCRALLEGAGFSEMDIREESVGHYISVAQAKNAWLKKEDFSPGQHPNPLRHAAPEIIAQAQREYEARIDALNTDKGVWNDLSMFYIYAFKE